jgi:hypothetical protein
MRIRFNLGKGDNYKTWKIEFQDERSPIYLNPELTQLVLIGAKLINRKSSAEKIYNGASKRPCAWIKCEDILIASKYSVVDKREIIYNPRVKPYWMCDDKNIDHSVFNKLITHGRKIYIIEDVLS